LITLKQILFQSDNTNEKILEIIAKGAAKLLQNYTANQLPGGKYWRPTPEVYLK